MAERIRWENTPVGTVSGHVGSIEQETFAIWEPPQASGEWVLESDLPGLGGARCYGDDPDALKAEAERWLAGFVSSLGAIFPDEPDCSAVTRFEVIDHTTDSKQQSVRYSPDIARSVVARNARVAASFQDDGRTLKVFLADPETTAVTAAREKD